MCRRPLYLVALLFGSLATAQVNSPPETIRVERIEPDGTLSHLPRWRAPSAPHWGVALSGGAALGLAHLGVLRGLEEDGLTPDLIAGTSAGALIGGMYASGYSTDVIERVFREKNWNAIFRETPRTRGISTEMDPLDARVSLGSMGRTADGKPFPWRGLVDDWQIFREFVRYFGRASAVTGRDLDRLPIRFRAVACDLTSGEVFAPRHAPLDTIIRASIGLPIFTPVRFGDRDLVDGGVLENIPVPTAQSMGAEVVVAVHFTGVKDGELKSFLKVLDRTYKVSAGAQRRPAVEAADAAVGVDTTGLAGTDFFGAIDELIAAGSAAWQADREQVIATLERFDDSAAWYEVRAIVAGEGVSDDVLRAVSERLSLDGSRRRVSRLRLEIALIALLMTGNHEDGSWVVLPDGRLRLSLVPAPRVEELVLHVPAVLEPHFAALRAAGVSGLTPLAVLDRIEHALLDVRGAGYFLAGVSEFTLDGSSGSLEVRIDSGELGEIELVDSGGQALGLPRPLRHLRDRPANILELERSLVRMGNVEGLRREGSALVPTDEGYRLRVAVADAPRWHATWNAGLTDTQGILLMGQIARPAVYGKRRWGTELRAGFNRENLAIGAETTPTWDHRLVPYVRAGVARPGLHLFDDAGQPQEWKYFYTAVVSAGYRSIPSLVGQFEFGPKYRYTTGSAFFPVEQESSTHDLSFELLWYGDLRDDPRAARRGLSWSIGGALPVAGDERPWIAYGDVAATLRLGGRFRLGLLGRIAETEEGKPLPADRWGDAGAYWEAPGMSAGRSRAREFHRVTLVLRRELGEIFGAKVSVGLSAAQWELSAERVDSFLDDKGRGASVFVRASTARLGPVHVGYSFSDVEGEIGLGRWFILLSPTRIAWPGPIRPREGAIIR